MTCKLRDDAVWITWERQTRNRSTSAYLNVPLFEIVNDGSRRGVRYLKSALRTAFIVLKHRPRYFFAQNPSVVLALLAIFLGRLGNCKVIIDAHNAGIHGPEQNATLVSKLNRFIIRKADAIIVTNAELANHVDSTGGNAIVLPDPLPKFLCNDIAVEETKGSQLNALCITSWSDDEPYLEILEAASKFECEISFHFSGNYKKIEHLLPNEIPGNVTLLGFVDEPTFQRHLFSADFCIDMTKRKDCMVCGAYESIAAGKPIILSDTSVQRLYFSKGTIFSDNSAPAIVKAVESMKDRIGDMKIEVACLKRDILKRESHEKISILSKIEQL